MKAYKYISKREHKLFLAVAAMAFVFSIGAFLTYKIKADFTRSEFFRIQEENRSQNKPVFSGPYCYPDKHPQVLFTIVILVGATFCSLCFIKTYLLSFLLTIASLTRFAYWFVETRTELVYDELNTIKGLNRVFYKAGDFDVCVFILISILLFWQISILLRMLIKTSQKENVLP